MKKRDPFKKILRECKMESAPILGSFTALLFQIARDLPEQVPRQGLPKGELLPLTRTQFYFAICQFLNPKINLKAFAKVTDVPYGTIKRWSVSRKIGQEVVGLILLFSQWFEAHIRNLFPDILRLKSEDYELQLDRIVSEVLHYKNADLTKMLVAGWIGVVRKDSGQVGKNYSATIRAENPFVLPIKEKLPPKRVVAEDDIYNSMFVCMFAAKLFRVARLVLPADLELVPTYGEFAAIKVCDLDDFLWGGMFAQLEKLIQGGDDHGGREFTRFMNNERKRLCRERDAWRERFEKKSKKNKPVSGQR